ncbi:hypothetical protein M569_14039 [Genlisea aurea]|uniref:Uncharacterized protein n=1 Tax=Genlisea aurea TaxID=192259 RepID=S8DMD5_9LAMI|nr:hypothetical protein M569_14039 [Genlisea aurea]
MHSWPASVRAWEPSVPTLRRCSVSSGFLALESRSSSPSPQTLVTALAEIDSPSVTFSLAGSGVVASVRRGDTFPTLVVGDAEARTDLALSLPFQGLSRLASPEMVRELSSSSFRIRAMLVLEAGTSSRSLEVARG